MLAKVTDEIMHTVPASCTHWAEYCGSYVQCYKPFKHSYLKILSIRDFLPLVPKSHCTKNETSLALKNISWSYTPIWSKNQEQAKLLWAWTDVGFLCVCINLSVYVSTCVHTHTHTQLHTEHFVYDVGSEIAGQSSQETGVLRQPGPSWAAA